MTTPQARHDLRSVFAGLVVMAVIAAGIYVSVKAQTGMPFATTTRVQAVVADVHTLAVNDQVRQNSRRIGRVSAVDYKDGQALVTMELEGRHEIHKDATAQVWDASALAMKFVEITPGTPAAGDLGDHPIPASSTQSSADLQQLLAVFDPTTRDRATKALRQVGGGLTGHSRDLNDFLGASPDLLGDLGLTAGVLADPDTDLAGLLRAGNSLAARFSGREQQINALVHQSDETLQALSTDDGGPLKATLAKSPDTLVAARGALAALDQPLDDLGRTMSRTAPGATALGRSTPDLRGLMRESVPVLGQVPPVAALAVPAVVDLTSTVADARPLAPVLAATVEYLATPLGVLMPFGPEIGQFFGRGHSFVSEGPEPGVRFARLSPNVEVSSVTGGLFSSNYHRNEYPEPGQASNDHAQTGLPTGLVPKRSSR